MDYLGKAVKFQHRVATGHARLRPGSAGQPTRHHIPVPTKLEIVDAIVLLEVRVEGEEYPRVSLLYPTGKAMNGADYQNSIAIAHDVPHASHDEAEVGLRWKELSDSDDSTRLVEAIQAARTQLDAQRRENELLRAKWEASTEGTDEKLQKKADDGARKPLVIETKNYSDGSSATGPAPLPDLSPEQQAAQQAPASDDVIAALESAAAADDASEPQTGQASDASQGSD